MHLTARFQTHLEPTNSSFLHPRSEAKKTKVKKKTNNPHFDEVFYFEVGVSVGRTLSLGTKTVSKSQFEPPDCLNLSHLSQELSRPSPEILRSGWHLNPWSFSSSSGEKSHTSLPEPVGSHWKGQIDAVAAPPGLRVGLFVWLWGFCFPGCSPQLPQAG